MDPLGLDDAGGAWEPRTLYEKVEAAAREAGLHDYAPDPSNLLSGVAKKLNRPTAVNPAVKRAGVRVVGTGESQTLEMRPEVAKAVEAGEIMPLVSSFYNEFFHMAYESDECGWIRQLVELDAKHFFGVEELTDDMREAGEEALSEMIDTIVRATYEFNKPKRPSGFPGVAIARPPLDLGYDRQAVEYLHERVADRFDAALAAKKVSRRLYELALYIVFFGIEAPEGCDPTKDRSSTIFRAVKKHVQGIGPYVEND